MNQTKPFLRWAGGKSWLTKEVLKFLPKKTGSYYEPFLGGASIFFYLKQNEFIRKSTLSDVNSSLIEVYKTLRDEPELLFKELKRYKNTSDFYYKEREKNYDDPIKRSARFIFLNRTSFNGIYRENLKGIYNVPYGHKTYKTLFDIENFERASKLLQGVNLKVSDFESIITKAKAGDLIFIDPPYTVAHENNGFVKYNQKIFSWEDQIRLKNCINRLNKDGVYFILTNAFHKSISDLYQNLGTPYKLERYSVVGGLNAKREKYHEIIITNVKLKDF